MVVFASCIYPTVVQACIIVLAPSLGIYDDSPFINQGILRSETLQVSAVDLESLELEKLPLESLILFTKIIYEMNRVILLRDDKCWCCPVGAIHLLKCAFGARLFGKLFCTLLVLRTVSLNIRNS